MVVDHQKSKLSDLSSLKKHYVMKFDEIFPDSLTTAELAPNFFLGQRLNVNELGKRNMAVQALELANLSSNLVFLLAL